MVDRYDIENDFAAQKEFDATQEGRILSLASQNAALEQRVRELEAERDKQSEARLGQQRYITQLEKNESVAVKTIEDLRTENKRLQEYNTGWIERCKKFRQNDFDEAQTRLKEQAEAYSELIAQLHRDVAARDGEIEQLKAWKESSIEVENSWDAQQVARLMGLLPGDDIRSNIEPYIRKINAEIVRLREALVDINNIKFDLPAKIYIYDKMKAIVSKALGGGE